MSSPQTTKAATVTQAYPIGPLTTTFSQPSHCDTAVYYYGEIDRGVTCGYDGRATYDGYCFPSAAAGYPDPNRQMLYSPAVGCPDGWESGSDTRSPTSRADTPGTTRTGCCPSNYSFYSAASCYSPIDYTSGTSVVMACAVAGSMSGTGSSMTATTISASSYSYVWLQQIEIVMVDSTTSSEASVTALGERSSRSATASPTSDPTPSDTPSPKKGGISAGAIAGIVVGVLAVAILVAAALFLTRRRKQRQTAASANPDALPEYVGGNGVTKGPGQMTTQSSTGLFQPQPELHGPAR